MSAKNILVLPANLHIGTVSELRDKAVQALEADKDITIRAQDSTRLDTAGLQLLLAVQSAQQKKGKKLRWGKVNAEFTKCVELLGARELLLSGCESD